MPRFRHLGLLGGAILGFMLFIQITSPGASAADPIDVGGSKQLFIDSRFIESSQNVTLTANRADKLGVVFMSETAPFEQHPLFLGNVFEDGDKFKMYYSAITPAGHSLAYAESTDAITWTRPPLGLASINGDTNNNIIMGDQNNVSPDHAMVFRDERDQTGRPYRLFMSILHNPFDTSTDGVYAYDSDDGFHFTQVRRVLPLLLDNPANVLWDGRLGKYVIFTRALATSGGNQRQIARIVTDDPMQPWPYNTSAPDYHGFATTEHLNVVLKADDAIDPFSDIYYNNAILYPWAQDVYLMFITPFRHFTTSQQPWFRFQPGNDYGLLDTQLAVSRDGITWTRPSRAPYFPMGMADEWDRWLVDMGRGMVRKGNYLYQYYMSGGHTHDGGVLRPEHDALVEPKSGFGVVRQRLDGFMSADVNENGGWLLTPPLVFSGSRLRLNIDTGAMGTAFVEIRNADGAPIPGFTLAEAEETGGNYINQQVYWKGNADVSSLAGKPIRLYFKLTSAKLYAFQFTEAE